MRWMILSLLFITSIFAVEPPSRIEGVAVCTPDRPTENVVVFLTGPHLKTSEPPEDRVVLDQRSVLFVPHVLPILRGTTVVFPNSDPIRHNVFSASEARMFNLGTYSSGISRTVTFEKPGVVELLCNVHPEMSAFILVLETPYFATTDGRGFFRLDNVEAEEYSMSFWCEHRGFISRNLTLNAGQTVNVNAVLHTNQVKLERGEAFPSQEENQQ